MANQTEERIKTWQPRQSLTSNEKTLWASTLGLEIPGCATRFLLLLIFGPLCLFPLYIPTLIIAPILQVIFDISNFVASLYSNALISFLLAALNIIIAILTLNNLIISYMAGNTFTRFAMGARDPSQREREAVLAAFERIAESAPKGVVAPSYWYVLDDTQLNAYMIGSTLYVTRELIKSSYLAAVVAHEYGHINSPDSRITLANRRLVLPFLYLLRQTTGRQTAPGMLILVGETSSYQLAYALGLTIYFFSILLGLAAGGLGLFLLNPLWTWHWREREYYADNFAAQCGFAQDLINYLEQYQFFDVATPFFMSDHPYSELRIDKLLAYLEQAA